MKLFSVILPALLALASSTHAMDPLSSQKLCMGPKHVHRVMECKAEAKEHMPSEEEAQEAINHVEEPFNMWDFVRGYANDKVLMFECMGWLTDCGAAVNISRVRQFMMKTNVAPWFNGEMGTNPLMQCSIVSETVTINDFFRGAEPNNEVPCDCEGDVCKDDSHPDGEDEAEDRFSIAALMAGKHEHIDQDLVKQIHNGEHFLIFWLGS